MAKKQTPDKKPQSSPKPPPEGDNKSPPSEGEQGGGKETKSNDISLDKLIKAHKINIARKIQAGETGLARELEHLQNLESRIRAENLQPLKSEIQNLSSASTGDPKSEIDEEIGIPDHLRIKRSYVKSPNYMSEAAREVRRKGGRARAAKFPAPNWKHGKYAQSFIVKAIRPCKSTCRDYPCKLIEEGSTKPGEACLDKSAVIQMYSALNDAIKHKKYDEFNEIASLTIAQSIHTLHMLLEDVIRDGPTLKREKHGSDGVVIGYDYVTHPALLALPKMIADLGMTPQEFMTTPRAIAKQSTEEEGAETLAQFLSNLGTKMQKKSGIQKNTNE